MAGSPADPHCNSCSFFHTVRKFSLWRCCFPRLYVSKFSTIFNFLTKLNVTYRHQSNTAKSAKIFLTVHALTQTFYLQILCKLFVHINAKFAHQDFAIATRGVGSETDPALTVVDRSQIAHPHTHTHTLARVRCPTNTHQAI